MADIAAIITKVNRKTSLRYKNRYRTCLDEQKIVRYKNECITKIESQVISNRSEPNRYSVQGKVVVNICMSKNSSRALKNK
jgi:hypothetical protein